MKKCHKFLALFLAVLLLTQSFGLSAFAADPAPTAPEAEIKVTDIQAPETIEEQSQLLGEQNLSFKFNLSLKNPGDQFEAGQVYYLPTNLSKLFNAYWPMLKEKPIRITSAQNELLATLHLEKAGNGHSERFVITMQEGAAGKNFLSADQVTFGEFALTANVVGAKKDQPVTKTLTIGDNKKNIQFTAKPDSSVRPDLSVGALDNNVMWKISWSEYNGLRAYSELRVNPRGCFELYGYDTNPDYGHKVTVYDPLYVEDPIPEHGIVDRSSLHIYAQSSWIGVRTEDTQYGGVPIGAWYPLNQNSIRYDLAMDDNRDNVQGPRMQELTQKPGETYQEFKERILSKQLQWGIYCRENPAPNEARETIMCNFGRVGDPENNNGIKYSDYQWQAGKLAAEHPELFGDEGPTGGNMPMYCITFHSYYPEVVGEKYITNTATMTARVNDSENKTWDRNAGYTIRNYDMGSGVGYVSSKDLVLQLIDVDTKEAIANQTFKLQKKNDQNKWIDAEGIEVQTSDANGRVEFKSLVPGAYRVVQTSWAEGYEHQTVYQKANLNNDKGEVGAHNLTPAGEFTIKTEDSFGFGSIVTNEKVKEDQSFTYDFALENQYDVQIADLNSVKNITIDGTTPEGVKLTFTPFDKNNDTNAVIGLTYRPANARGQLITLKLNVERPHGISHETVTILPASNVLYEGGFQQIAAEGKAAWNKTSESAVTAPITDNAKTAFGYSESYKNCKQAETWTADVSETGVTQTRELTFDFQGIGFDLIGGCGPQTGTLAVRISDDADKTVKSYLVDTKFTDTEILKNQEMLQQIPLVHVQGLADQAYTVHVRGAYISWDNSKAASTFALNDSLILPDEARELLSGMGVSDEEMEQVEVIVLNSQPAVSTFAAEPAPAQMKLSLNGCRVYRSTDQEAYPAETEKNMIYTNVLDAVQNGFGAYVEPKNAQNLKEGFSKADYEAAGGPQNEIYLAKGQSVSFAIQSGAPVQISASAVGNQAAVLTVGSTNLTVDHNTEMYYKVAVGANNVLTVTNTGEGLLALGNLKTLEQLPVMTEEQVAEAVRATAQVFDVTLPEEPEVDPEEPDVDPEKPEVDPEGPEVDPEEPDAPEVQYPIEVRFVRSGLFFGRKETVTVTVHPGESVQAPHIRNFFGSRKVWQSTDGEITAASDGWISYEQLADALETVEEDSVVTFEISRLRRSFF